MKKQILDEPIKQEISDLLKTGETILWEGKPDNESLESSFLLTFLFFTLPIGYIFLFTYATGGLEDFLSQFYSYIIGVGILLGTILSINFSRQLKRKRIKYFITKDQIIFQFQKSLKKIFHSISFSEIKNIQVINIDPYPEFEEMEKGNEFGTIFLSIKNPELIPFQTYDFRNKEKRAQPTLELIETKRAAELIRMGIKNANASL